MGSFDSAASDNNSKRMGAFNSAASNNSKPRGAFNSAAGNNNSNMYLFELEKERQAYGRI